MKIIRSTEPIAVAHPVFCLFGQPGIGKSTLGYSMRKPLTLDFDSGAHRAANREDTLLIESWADVEELTKETLAPYESIVVDTVGRCLDLLSADIIDKNPKHGRGGSLSLQGFGELKARFRLWMTLLRAMGKDVLLIAHDKEEKDGDVRIVRPDITGGSYAEVLKIADFVGYASMNGKARELDFNPTDRWVGKNPGGWAPFKIPPVAKATTFMADLYDKGRAALGTISEVSARAAQVVDDWRAAIDSYTTTDEINKAIPEIATLAPVLAPQIKKLLFDRAKALGFVWNLGAKAYTQPAVEAVV